MPLEEYNRKRDFDKTREPSGEVKASAGGDLFVVQKHAASRLHYDFRLELDGVLLSWSVPKGPSLDPAQKRLAVRVEDHPLDYAMFEGLIPKGQYGGGTVLLWDRGTWEPLGDARAMVRAGNLKFSLRGEKLRGKYALVKLKERHAPRGSGDARNWLLIKERDAEARPEAELDITAARAESVATQRTMEQIAADPTHVWHSNRVQVALDDVPGARPAEPPARPRPAQLVGRARPPEGPGWLHEMHIEGRRLLARAGLNQEVQLFDEAGKRLPPKATAGLAAIANAVRLLPAQGVVVDGVATALYPDGRPRARGLAEALAGQGGGDGAPALVFYLTDLLFLDGHDLAETPLARRKALLAKLVARVRPPGILRVSEHFEGDGAAFYREACRVGLPGVVSRRADSPTPPPRGAAVLVKCAAPAPRERAARRPNARARA
ncbi:MAG TPA: DNA polymerase ligase N-terminal domain-containing protein [Polyangia bacterium]|nr:DNA polymerase ligase N-terminal domain-containing protein [Polyangia bacterium]